MGEIQSQGVGSRGFCSGGMGSGNKFPVVNLTFCHLHPKFLFKYLTWDFESKDFRNGDNNRLELGIGLEESQNLWITKYGLLYLL